MSPFRRLLRYIVRYRRAFTLGLICSVITTAITLVAPLVLRYAIDDLTAEVTRAKLVLYASELLGVGLVGGVFRFWTRRILIGASRDMEYDMRNDFFAHLETLPLSYYQANRTGDLMSRATNDLNAVRMMIGPSIMYSANTLLTFVAALAMMVAIDARLTLLSLIPLPFVSISVNYFASRIHKGFEQIQAQLSEVSAVAQEALAGVRVVRAYRQESAEIERFRLANLEYLRRNRKLIVLQGFFFPTMSFFLGLGSMLVLWLGSRAVITHRITLGEFVAFFAYLTMLSWPMIAFGWVTNMLQRGMASWKRMLQILDTEPAIRDQAGPQPSLPAIRGEIEFRNLSFSFGDTPILRDISVSIPAGQTTAIVGVTGSGKSTLIGLITRLHEPPAGTVLVDGRDVREWPLATLRSAIGFVPQEPFLFSDTIGDNVAFGLDARRFAHDGQDAQGLRPQSGLEPGVADTKWSRERRELIERAAATSRLDKDLADFPKGYDTMVGERGITLSGGQKQRTALARAIAVDPKILILDDSLSAVDTYTEEEILSRLRGVMRERTSLIVSHRISTVRDADQILVLDDGRIAERGTHDELIARNGLYAELHEKQLLEEELGSLLMQDDEILGKAYDGRLMRRLLVYLRPYWRSVSIAFVAIIVGAGAALAQPYLMKVAIDRYIAPSQLEGLNQLALLYVAVLVVAFVSEYVQTWTMLLTGQRIMFDMRMAIYRHLQRLDLRYYDRNPVGRLMTRVTSDVDVMNDLFTSGVVTIFGDIFTLLGIMGVMLWMNWRLALVAFAVLPIIALITNWFRRNVRDSYRVVRGWIAKINAFLQENITGMTTVQLFRREALNFARFDDIDRKHRDANIDSIFYYAVFYPAIEAVSALASALIIWYGGASVMSGTLTLGALAAFLQYSQRFFRPISDMSEKFNVLQSAMASSERIFKLLDEPVEIASPPKALVPRVEGRGGHIVFDHVSFAYNHAEGSEPEWVLRDVSFEVKPGQRIGIVGATGSGKTTLINLLLRFYDVQRGTVTIDGVDVRRRSLDDLRQMFSLVLQDVHLFSGTIADNIRLGNSSITDDQVRAAAQAVHADVFIERLSTGYDAPVAERGSTLSVGQKQLLSFARALAFDPRVLILDEATSSVDTETELLIRDALNTLMAGRTTIAIAHRLSTIQDMDKILVLHKGVLREEGTHQELLAARGIYYKLFELQYAQRGSAETTPTEVGG